MDNTDTVLPLGSMLSGGADIKHTEGIKRNKIVWTEARVHGVHGL